MIMIRWYLINYTKKRIVCYIIVIMIVYRYIKTVFYINLLVRVIKLKSYDKKNVFFIHGLLQHPWTQHVPKHRGQNPPRWWRWLEYRDILELPMEPLVHLRKQMGWGEKLRGRLLPRVLGVHMVLLFKDKLGDKPGLSGWEFRDWPSRGS